MIMRIRIIEALFSNYIKIGPQPPRCCTENTAECLSCQTGQSLDEYCRIYPRMIGCPGRNGT